MGSFQLCSVLSNFNRFFPISLGSFQLQGKFPTSDFPTSRSSQLPFPTTRIPKNHPKNQTYDQVLRIFVWILFPEMTLGDTPETNFSKFSWILFPKMTLGETPNFWILFPRFANMGLMVNVLMDWNSRDNL